MNMTASLNIKMSGMTYLRFEYDCNMLVLLWGDGMYLTPHPSEPDAT